MQMLEDQEICMLSPDWFLEVMKNPVYSGGFISEEEATKHNLPKIYLSMICDK